MLQLLRLCKYFPLDSGLKGLYGPHSRQTLLGHSFGFVPHYVNLIILHGPCVNNILLWKHWP